MTVVRCIWYRFVWVWHLFEVAIAGNPMKKETRVDQTFLADQGQYFEGPTIFGVLLG